jgi:hypothetical protein
MSRPVLTLVFVSTVLAATQVWAVTTINVAAGEVLVDAGNGRCSLREAIANANAGTDVSGGDCTAGTGGPDSISLAAGSIYNLPDIATSHADYGDSGLPAITSAITILGNGATIQRSTDLFSSSPCTDSTSSFRIFFVDLSGDLTLENLTLRNGCADFSIATGAGGAIFNRGVVTLNECTVSNNEANVSAGAIQNDGMLTLSRSTIAGNDVLVGAGGGIVNTGVFTALQSTISNNDTPGAGGAVYNSDKKDNMATIANSTMSGNQSDGTGGGLQDEGSSTVTNATIAFNNGTAEGASPGTGGGVYSLGTTSLANTIVALQVNSSDCGGGGLSDLGHNLDSDGTCLGAATSADPGLGPLSNNGGPTKTHALLQGSPAIDAGDNDTCAASPVDRVDQRDVLRPQLGATSLTCDIGAFELKMASHAPALAPWALALLALALSGLGVFTLRLRSTRASVGY